MCKFVHVCEYSVDGCVFTCVVCTNVTAGARLVSHHTHTHTLPAYRTCFPLRCVHMPAHACGLYCLADLLRMLPAELRTHGHARVQSMLHRQLIAHAFL